MARLKGAPASAAELLELAIGLGGDTSERRILSAANHFDAGDLVEARRHLQHIIDRLGPNPVRAEAMKLLGLVRISDDSFVEAARLLEQAIEESGDPVSRVQMLVMLSYALFNTGSTESALAHADDAVVSATRLELPALVSQALGMRTMFRFLVGDGVDEASLARARELDDHSETVPVPTRPRLQYALLRAWSGHFEDGAAELVAIQKRCAERGEDNDLVFLGFHTVLVYVWQGKFGEADQVAVDLMERALQLGGDLPMFVALTVRASIGAYAGRADEVRRDTAGALAAGERCSSQRLAEWAVTSLGFLEVSLGHYEQALATLEPLLTTLAAAPKMTELMSASFVPDAVEAMVAVGRLADAEGLVDLLEDNGRRLNRAWMSAVGARGRGMVLAARGELAAASDAAAQAMEYHRELGMPFERARTELLLGQLERRNRRRGAAASTLGRALRTFEELGIPLWAERVRTELARVGGSVRGASGLTAAELRVAKLAASGATNRDMATALFISPKTVEANLTRIYRKLDVHSRAELVRVMGELDQ
jgi:DNA-binding CsgD family transcriptional regulator